MWINYEHSDLIRLFGSVPDLTAPEEVQEYMYVAEDERGVKLVFCFSTFGKTCNISLSYDGSEDSVLFETALKNVEYFRTEGEYWEYLRIHQTRAEKDYIIHFRPNLFISHE